MMHKVKHIAAMLKHWFEGDPTIGLVRPIYTLSSVEKNIIKGVNQRFSQCQLITREYENIDGDSKGNPDTGNFSVACEEYIHCSSTGKPASIREI